MAATAPDLPLFPHVRAARVIEYLKGTVDLTESGYQSTAGDVRGTVVFSMTHSDWQEPMKQYGKKYRIADGAPVSFNAGFAMLRAGRADLRCRPAAGPRRGDRPVVAGGRIRDTTSSRPHRGVMRASGTRRSPTSCKTDRKPTTIPLWIVPSLVPGSDRADAADRPALDPADQWPRLPDRHPAERCPRPRDRAFDRHPACRSRRRGEHAERRPRQRGDHGPDARGELTDHRLAAGPPKDPDHNYSQLQERKSRSLTIRFEKPIPRSPGCPDGSRRPLREPSPALPVSASTCRVAGTVSGN